MSEREQKITRLVARTGYDREEVTHLLDRQGFAEKEIVYASLDEDLFLEPPELRFFSAAPEEQVEEWRKAERVLNSLAGATNGEELFDSIGVHVILADGAARATEARRRWEQRARQAS
jgi:hypothetical protein